MMLLLHFVSAGLVIAGANGVSAGSSLASYIHTRPTLRRRQAITLASDDNFVKHTYYATKDPIVKTHEFEAPICSENKMLNCLELSRIRIDASMIRDIYTDCINVCGNFHTCRHIFRVIRVVLLGWIGQPRSTVGCIYCEVRLTPYNFYTVSISCMMASWHGKALSIAGPLWGESTDDRWIPLTKGPVMWSFAIIFVFSLNKSLNKQWIYRWFEAA